MIYREEIEKVLQTLTPREEKVIRLRYGLVIIDHALLKRLVKNLVSLAKELDRLKPKQLEDFDIQVD